MNRGIPRGIPVPSHPFAEAASDATFTDEQIEAMTEESRRQQAHYLLAEWARERRDFWKSIITTACAGIALKGEAPTDDLLASANLALRWFDEKFGGEFPLEVKMPIATKAPATPRPRPGDGTDHG